MHVTQSQAYKVFPPSPSATFISIFMPALHIIQANSQSQTLPGILQPRLCIGLTLA